MRKIVFTVFLAIGLADIANTAKADSPPDLFINAVSFTSDKLEFTIRNIGGAYTYDVLISGQWLDQSKDPLGDPLDLGAYALPRGLDPVKAVRRDQFLWNENFIPSGTRYLMLTVSPYISVEERDPDNNSAEIARPLPDVTIDSVTLDPTYGYPVVTIKNIGTSKATRYSFPVSYGWNAANQTFNRSYNINLDLNPGQTYVAESDNPSIDLALSPEANNAFVIIGRNITGTNQTFQIAESDYTNNQKSIDNISFPDLAINSVAFDETYGYPVVSIKNISRKTAKHPAFRIYYSWSDSRRSRFYEVNLDLAPGQTFIAKAANPSADLAPDPAAGSINLYIGRDADMRGQIAESDYANNDKSVDLAFADLAIDSVAFDPTLGYPIVTIKNIGTGTAKRANLTVSYKYPVPGLTYGSSYDVDLDLAPGQTYIAKSDNLPAVGPGVKSMLFTIGQDSRSGNYQIFESDYSNNRKTVDVIQPDLAIESVNFDTTYSYPIVTIKNIGASNARHPAFTVSYKVNSVLRSYEVNLDLDAGETLVARPANPSSGVSFLEGPATDLKIGQDAQGNYQLAEFDYKNNKAALPDFAVDSVTFNSDTKAVNVAISNVGSVTARFTAEEWDGGPTVQLTCHKADESSAEGYNCEPGKYLTTSAQSSLDPGAKITINFPALESDIKYIDVSVNIPIKLSELNLSNNAKRVDVPQASADSLKYPIPELGNCADKAACKAYCELPENAAACAEFGVSRDLLTAEEAQALLDLANITNGPGGCTTKKGCAAFCEVPANIEACLNYAEQNNWMTADDLSKARKVAGVLQASGATPGSCTTPTTCKTYCSDNSHAVECVAFGKSAGLLTAEEAAEAEKVAPFIQSGQVPGGNPDRAAMEAYCENNRDECDRFFEQAGVKKGGPPGEPSTPPMIQETGGAAKAGAGGCTTKAECETYCESHPSDKECSKGAAQNTKTIFKDESGAQKEGPGGCKTQAECTAYCDAHPGECDNAVRQAGGDVKEATSTCATVAECRSFCETNRDNKACADGTIMLGKEETPAVPAEGEAPGSPIDQLRNDIKAMTPQEQDCVRQKIGAEVFDKFVVAGGLPEKPLRREDIQSCMSPPQPSSSLERKGFSSVLASIVNVLFGWLKP